MRSDDKRLLPRHPEAIRALIRKLWDEGASTTAIGRQVGMSRNSVGNLARRMQLSGRDSPIHPSAPGKAVASKARGPLPAGSPETWGLITSNTWMEGLRFGDSPDHRTEPMCRQPIMGR